MHPGTTVNLGERPSTGVVGSFRVVIKNFLSLCTFFGFDFP